MAISLLISPKFSRRVKSSSLRDVALKTLHAEAVGAEPNLSIVITDDRTMRGLNRRYHHVDTSTDVLSFSSDEPGYLGDVVISFETARNNARRVGWPTHDELQLLVVHGVLHLLGYDDTKPRARARMWQRQAEILGISLDAIDTPHTAS